MGRDGTRWDGTGLLSAAAAAVVAVAVVAALMLLVLGSWFLVVCVYVLKVQQNGLIFLFTFTDVFVCLYICLSCLFYLFYRSSLSILSSLGMKWDGIG